MARLGLTAGVLGQVALLCCLDATAGLGPAGWLAGLAWVTAVVALIARGLGVRWTTQPGSVQPGSVQQGSVQQGSAPLGSLGPANRVTLLRAVLVGGVAALVVDGVLGSLHSTTVGALAAAALVLDAADGWVARRTGSATALGARFDMEVDAFLTLLLSVAVAASTGEWVLLIGLARYVLLLAGLAAPWLRAPVPARTWRKAVAATQGIVLTAVVGGALPESIAPVALALAAAALCASFAEQAHWLWIHRRQSESSSRRAPGARPVATRAT